MSTLITICARGGSKGIPTKNIKIIGEKPLIAYSIKTAREFAENHNGILELSTDNERIHDIASQFGLKTDYIRPAELATDTAGKIPTIRDVLLYSEKKHHCNFSYILDLDVTSPLRTLADLEAAFEMLKADAEALNLFSVNKAHRNPYFNMVEQAGDGYYRLVKTPEKPILSRQTAPKVFDLNASFYFYHRKFFDLNYRNAYTEKSLVYEMPHMCFDLDEPVDFEFMSYLLENNKLGFDL